MSLSIGEVRVSLPDMDREVKGQYEVVIQAKDMAGQLGGLAGTTTVNITLSDVNDNPPRFTQSENFSTDNINNQRYYSQHPDVDLQTYFLRRYSQRLTFWNVSQQPLTFVCCGFD